MKRKSAWIALSFLLTACSSQQSTYQTDFLPISKSDSIESKTIDVSADSDAFAALSTETSLTTAEAYYDSVGGESARRVAFALYGRHDAKLLKKENPQLNIFEKLSIEQKIFFEFPRANLQANYLTKGMVERYSDELSQEFRAKATKLDTTVVNSGETLQQVSMRLYGTTRFWTELYLLNKSDLESFDSVKKGQKLSYRVPDASNGAVTAAVVDSQKAKRASAEPVRPVKKNISKPVAAQANVEEPVAIIEIPEAAPAPTYEEKLPQAASAPVQETAPAAPPPAVQASSAIQDTTMPVATKDADPLWRSGLYVGVAFLFLLGALFGARVINKRKKGGNIMVSAIGKSTALRFGVPIPGAKKATSPNKDKVS